MKKILFVSAFEPSTLTAGQNYTRLLLDDLATSYQVDVCYFYNKKHEAGNYIGGLGIRLKKKWAVNLASRILNACFAAIYFFPFSFRFNWRILFYLRNIQKEYDYVMLNFAQSFLYSAFLDKNKIVLIVHDVLYQSISRKQSFINKIMLEWCRATESYCYSAARKIFCHSYKDVDLIRTIYEKEAVQINLYLDENLRNLDFSNVTNGDYFVLYGYWRRKENWTGLLWLLDNLKVESQLKLKIIGGGMPDELKQRLKEMSNCDYLGYVADPYPIIASAKALIAPLLIGAGVKVKVVEALSLGVPVIGTSVAWEGIYNYVIGQPLCVKTDDVSEFVAVLENYPLVTRRDKDAIRDVFIQRYGCNNIKQYL